MRGAVNDGGREMFIFDKLARALVVGFEVRRRLYGTKHVQQRKLIDGRRGGVGWGARQLRAAGGRIGRSEAGVAYLGPRWLEAGCKQPQRPPPSRGPFHERRGFPIGQTIARNARRETGFLPCECVRGRRGFPMWRTISGNACRETVLFPCGCVHERRGFPLWRTISGNACRETVFLPCGCVHERRGFPFA